MSLGTNSGEAEPAADARERIVTTAYDLFARHGLRAIGVDRIIAEAGVAKTTLYRHFRSKDDLVLAVLQRREEIWLDGWLLSVIAGRGAPEEQLLAIFDAFDEWFRRPDYEGCLFTNSLLESHGRTGPVGAASVMRLDNIRSALRALAEEAGVHDAQSFAHQWQTLMLGSIIQAAGGHAEAAHQARAVGELLLAQERLGSAGGGAKTEGR